MLSVVECEWMGLMYGDGCRMGKGRQCTLYTRDIDAFEVEHKVLRLLGWKYSIEEREKDKVVAFRFGVEPVKLLGWLEKKMIKSLDEFSDLELKGVLRGLFESDGWVSLSGSGQIGFEVSDERLGKFVKEGLNRVGIEAGFSVSNPSKNSFGRRLRYVTRVRRRSYRLFLESVGFITERKKSLLKDLSGVWNAS